MGVGVVMKEGKIVVTAAQAAAGINVDVGFIPAYVKLFNQEVADATIGILERFRGMDPGQSLSTTRMDNDGGSDATNIDNETVNGLSDYNANAVSQVETALTGSNFAKTEGSTLVTGTGSLFTTEVNVGDRINVGDEVLEVASITSNLLLNTTTKFRTTDATVTTGVVVIVPGAEVSQSGFKGFSIPATFMAENDVLWFFAMGTQFDEEDA